MKRKPTRADLLDRFVSLGVGGKSFEAENQLPRNLIAKMKQGDYSGIKAKDTIARFEEAIERAEAARVKPTAKPVKAPAGPKAASTPSTPVVESKAPSVAPVTTGRGQGRPRERVDPEIEEELLEKIRSADSPEKRDDLLRYVLELGALGKVSSEYARFANDAISNGRQLDKAKAEEEEKARGGEKIEIEVKTVADWRKKGPCPYCSGTGHIDPEAKIA